MGYIGQQPFTQPLVCRQLGRDAVERPGQKADFIAGRNFGGSFKIALFEVLHGRA